MDEFVWALPPREDDFNALSESFIRYKNLTHDTKGFVCRLCHPDCFYPVGFGHNEILDAHLGSDSHRDKVKEIGKKRHKLLTLFVKVQRVNARMKRYGSPDVIKSILSESMMNNLQRVDEAKELCDQYEKNEPFVCLELALWKGACMRHFPDDSRQILTHFFDGGWKKDKALHRNDPLICVVMENVLPFLRKKVLDSVPDPDKRYLQRCRHKRCLKRNRLDIMNG